MKAEIFLYLSPEDRAMARQVCHQWKVALDSIMCPKICLGPFASRIPLLEWALVNGCPKTSKMSCYVIICDRVKDGKIPCYGNLDGLKWLKEHGFKFGKETCAIAAAGGFLPMLKWLREEENCKWDFYTCLWSAQNGQLETFEYAYENGCDSQQAFAYAALNGRTNILEYLHWIKIINLNEVEAMWRSKYLCVIQWAHERGYRFNAHLYAYASDNDCLDIVKYAYTIGHPVDRYNAMVMICFKPDISEWAIKNIPKCAQYALDNPTWKPRRK
jgi:hypothetical protein